MNTKEIWGLLETCKEYVGLHKYHVEFVGFDEALGEDEAQIEVDIYKTTAKLSLHPRFKEKEATEQRSILIHELLHGRHQVFKEESDEVLRMLEEQYMNDLTAGMTALLEYNEALSECNKVSNALTSDL